MGSEVSYCGCEGSVKTIIAFCSRRLFPCALVRLWWWEVVVLFACGGGRLLCCLLVVVGGCCVVCLWWCEVVLFALGGVLLSCYAVALPYFVVGTGLFTLYVQRRKGG